MSNVAIPSGHQSPRTARPVSLFAGFLSFVVPGLGQLYQGRYGKGLLFLVSLYGLFFTGMYLGDWKNVYIPHTTANQPRRLSDLAWDIYNRPQFAGQFWIGIAAWPALWQYFQMPMPSAETSVFWHYFEFPPPESPEKVNAFGPYARWQGKTINELQTDGDKTWDLGWVYTMIAGVLNLLVIFDAATGPAVATNPESKREGDAA
jgi:hypothetical protein